MKVDAWLPDLQKVIGEQIATIRRKLCIPIIYHVEDYVFEGSQLSLVEQEDSYFKLLEHGLRFGVDYMVVDLKYSWDKVRRLMACCGRTKIIGQFLAKQEVEWSWLDPARINEHTAAKDLGCKLIKFVRQTSKEDDNTAVQAFFRNVDAIPNHLPVGLGIPQSSYVPVDAILFGYHLVAARYRSNDRNDIPVSIYASSVCLAYIQNSLSMQQAPVVDTLRWD